MPDPFVPRIGAVLSADIAVPDHDRVVAFYAAVLATGESPLWRENLKNNLGMPIIGLGAQSPEYADLPLQWMPHLQVADVGRSVERALELGATEVLHGREDDGTSQWAVLLDPNGAAFGTIPVPSAEEIAPSEGADAREGVAGIGHLAWLDLTVANASATRDFYQKVVGWGVQTVELEDSTGRYADFNMLAEDGTPAAGICHARGVNRGLPPVWLLYLPVADLAESLDRVRRGGGNIVKVTKAADGSLDSAVIEDPVGARVALAAG